MQGEAGVGACADASALTRSMLSAVGGSRLLPSSSSVSSGSAGDAILFFKPERPRSRRLPAVPRACQCQAPDDGRRPCQSRERGQAAAGVTARARVGDKRFMCPRGTGTTYTIIA